MPGGNARLGLLQSNTFSDTSNYGVRAREELKLTPNLTAIAGIGWEATHLKGINTSYAYNTPNVPTATPGVPIDRRPAIPEHGAGTRAALQAEQRMAVPRRASPQATARRRSATSSSSPNGQNGNNTQLKTQKNLGYDLGFDWTPNNALKFSATGFYEFFKDELVTPGDPGRRAQCELHVQRAEIGASRRRAGRRLEVLSGLAVHGRLYLSRRGLHRIHREHRPTARRLQLQPRRQQDSRHLAERTDGAAWL